MCWRIDSYQDGPVYWGDVSGYEDELVIERWSCWMGEMTVMHKMGGR